MTTSPPFKILALDDDLAFLRSLKRVLRNAPYSILTTTDPHQALDLIDTEQIGLVLLDLRMPQRDGLAVLEDLVSLYPDVPVIMLTGFGNIEQAVRAIKLGAADFLEKPCPPHILNRVLAKYQVIWEQRQSRTNTPGERSLFPDLVGESSAMGQVKAQIARTALSDAPVLVLGESGTGKELIARAIHDNSTRHGGPFCAVDCAALNESVLESELFGYERGAFTGADKPMRGLIRSADRGTLFLDEIGELPLKMQAKLLRTLQEQEVRPVGSTTSYPVDIRIVAATNRNLEDEIGSGHFRADLFFRIAAISIMAPPLRERGDDIALLAQHILGKLAPAGEEKTISGEALELLQAYHWPGNVRELENVLRRALAFAEHDTIKAIDLPATLVVGSQNNRLQEPPADTDSLQTYERTAMENALRKTKYNKRQAALLLGVSEATLYRKLKQYGLAN